MQSLYSKIYGSALAGMVALAVVPARASSTATIDLTATVTAACSLSAPSSLDLGEIPVTAFEGATAGQEISGYDRTFAITTTCSGTNRFTITFTPGSVNYNCLTASSGNMGFCLYEGNGNKIMLAGNRTVTAEGDEVNIKVVPLRIGTPTVGNHSASVMIMISPL
ncbi:spore coat protein U domain-containing protein [Erwinia sp. 198]|uniref:spore coat protein U domain-containing protein n=1 Tax=Erwinia sp. 198 TaxID=2022746 RepID=UPI000F66D139|nr:spore coat protein U domain-containing protein [Erwinia sp. 198]RRZ91582.1 hypothetical protein EGK14_11670 [Erwinia sp. 198]